MEIRKTTLQDVDTVLDVFAAAKRYMRANGNARNGATSTQTAASSPMISHAAAAM